MSLEDAFFAPMERVYSNFRSTLIGLQLRSVCWRDDRIVCGTRENEIIEAHVGDPSSARIVTQVGWAVMI